MSESANKLASLLLEKNSTSVFSTVYDGAGWMGSENGGGFHTQKSITLYPSLHNQTKNSQPDWSDFSEERPIHFSNTVEIAPEPESIGEKLPARIWSEDKKNWLTLCAEISRGIQKGDYKKIVPCRWKLAKISESEYPKLIKNISHLITQKEKSNFYKFLIRSNDSIFLGISPELLFSRNNGFINIPAIAGTILAESDNADILQKSEKNIIEHELVVKDLISSLKEIGLHPEINSARSLLKAGNLWHLHTSLKMRDPGFHILSSKDLIKKIHPTAAIGGSPQKAAMNFLQRNEGWDRGLFASPLLIREGEKEVCIICIRSALWKRENLWQFAGAGYVAESDPELEWNECSNKMNFLSDRIFGAF
jgi:menaquinone-specific isochorismate synthase